MPTSSAPVRALTTDYLPNVQLVVAPDDMMAAWQSAYADTATMERFLVWHDAYERWLKRYRSPATNRAYRESWADFFRFAGKFPWLVLSADAIAWQDHLENRGMAVASINRYLAALSSFYTFVIRDLRPTPDGRERSIFVDEAGLVQPNPFRAGNLERKRGRGRDVNPLSAADLRAMRDAINPATRTGARDAALFDAYLRTGRRLSEIVRLRWADIQPTRNGGYKFWWVGKGADRNPEKKTGWRPLPKSVYDAIVHYLRIDGRWPVPDDQMYIFQPLRDSGLAALHLQADAHRHISPGRVHGIVKKLARAAGIDAQRVHPHTLRHSFAFYLYDQTKDYKLVQDSLDHEDLKTTIGYINNMQEPEDRTSLALQAALGF